MSSVFRPTWLQQSGSVKVVRFQYMVEVAPTSTKVITGAKLYITYTLVWNVLEDGSNEVEIRCVDPQAFIVDTQEEYADIQWNYQFVDEVVYLDKDTLETKIHEDAYAPEPDFHPILDLPAMLEAFYTSQKWRSARYGGKWSGQEICDENGFSEETILGTDCVCTFEQTKLNTTPYVLGGMRMGEQTVQQYFDHVVKIAEDKEAEKHASRQLLLQSKMRMLECDMFRGLALAFEKNGAQRPIEVIRRQLYPALVSIHGVPLYFAVILYTAEYFLWEDLDITLSKVIKEKQPPATVSSLSEFMNRLFSSVSYFLRNLDPYPWDRERLIHDVFRRIDVNRSGRLTRKQVTNMLNKMKAKHTAPIMNELDMSADGTLNYYEFRALCVRNSETPAFPFFEDCKLPPPCIEGDVYWCELSGDDLSLNEATKQANQQYQDGLAANADKEVSKNAPFQGWKKAYAVLDYKEKFQLKFYPDKGKGSAGSRKGGVTIDLKNYQESDRLKNAQTRSSSYYVEIKKFPRKYKKTGSSPTYIRLVPASDDQEIRVWDRYLRKGMNNAASKEVTDRKILQQEKDEACSFLSKTMNPPLNFILVFTNRFIRSILFQLIRLHDHDLDKKSSSSTATTTTASTSATTTTTDSTPGNT